MLLFDLVFLFLSTNKSVYYFCHKNIDGIDLYRQMFWGNNISKYTRPISDDYILRVSSWKSEIIFHWGWLLRRIYKHIPRFQLTCETLLLSIPLDWNFISRFLSGANVKKSSSNEWILPGAPLWFPSFILHSIEDLDRWLFLRELEPFYWNFNL